MRLYNVKLQGGECWGGGLGGMAVVGFRGNKHKEWSMWKGKKGEKKKSTNYTNYVQHGFQTHTHPDRLIDEPNESPKIKGGK